MAERVLMTDAERGEFWRRRAEGFIRATQGQGKPGAKPTYGTGVPPGETKKRAAK